MSSEGKPVSWFIIIPVMLFGIGTLAGGSYLSWLTWDEVAASVQTPGTVVDLVEASSPKTPPWPKRPNLQGKLPGNKPSFAPLVEYTAAGKSYRIRGSVSSNPPAYSPGEHVTIRYLKDKPAEGKIDSFFENWMTPMILSIFGLIFTLAGSSLLVGRLRRAATSADGDGKVIALTGTDQ